MKILHICPSFWPNIGGVERFILDLVTRTREAGAEVSVVTLNAGGDSGTRLPVHDSIDGIPIRRLPFLDLRFYKPVALPLALLREADILHVHNVGAMLDIAVATRWLHRRPVVVSTHGGIFHTARLSLLKQAYFHGLQSVVGRGVNRFVADSKNDFALFSRIAQNLELIEIGIDTARFAGCTLEGKEKNRYLFVGRISRNKRIDHLLQTFAALKRLHVSFSLHIVGPDWEGLQGRLQASAEELGIRDRVVFTGPVSADRLRSELCSAEFFVSASEYEGFGISVVEAMAAGCIPIVSPIESFRNFVDSPRNGLLVNFSRSEEAARRIAAFRTNCAGVAEQARAVGESYSWETRIPRWMQTYEQVLAGNGG